MKKIFNTYEYARLIDRKNKKQSLEVLTENFFLIFNIVSLYTEFNHKLEIFNI
jgi:hypothetical protein